MPRARGTAPRRPAKKLRIAAEMAVEMDMESDAAEEPTPPPSPERAASPPPEEGWSRWCPGTNNWQDSELALLKHMEEDAEHILYLQQRAWMRTARTHFNKGTYGV